MTIGILYPRSNAYPGITVEFVDAVKACLQKERIKKEVHIFSEGVGFGGSEKEVYDKAEKLLLIEDVDILVGFVDLKVLDLLKPLLQSTGKMMLVVNPGANYPENWVAQANFIYLNLQHAFLSWLTGSMASQKQQTNGVVVSNFYDCGYGHMPAMVSNFMRTGGHIMFNYINTQKDNEIFEIKALTDYLSSDLNSTNLLCVYSASTPLLYNELNSFEGSSALQLYVSPMMLDAPMLNDKGNGYKFSIQGYQPWLPTSDSTANLDFTATYRKHTKKDPTSFSLLGWETGLILQQVLLNCKDRYREADFISSILSEIVIESPRGEMKLDSETNYFTAPFVECSLAQDSSKMQREMIKFPENEWKNYIMQPTEGFASGWLNTYLCY